MGLRKTVLQTIKNTLDNLLVPESGRHITATTSLFDPQLVPAEYLPKISVIPAPHSVRVGIMGHMMDSDYRISILGYTYHEPNETLFEASEDVIDAIIQELTSEVNANTFMQVGFSIVEFAPVMNEQWDDTGNMAYIHIGVAVQFVEN